jgi:hypothetical protein
MFPKVRPRPSLSEIWGDNNMDVPSHQILGDASTPVDTPLDHRSVSSTHYTTIRNDIIKLWGCRPKRFQCMAVFVIRSDRSDRITKQPISFAAPLDHRITQLMGPGSTCVDPWFDPTTFGNQCDQWPMTLWPTVYSAAHTWLHFKYIILQIKAIYRLPSIYYDSNDTVWSKLLRVAFFTNFHARI